MITIATLVNELDGTTTTVTRDETSNGPKFQVCMRDDDSGNWLNYRSIYNNEVQALRYAHHISGVEVA